MNKYEKYKFLKEELKAPRFENEYEEIEWFAVQLYGLCNQASRLREENEKLKDNWNKLKEWLSEQPIFDYLSPADIKIKMQELEKGDSNE